MVGIVLASHGDFAAGIKQSVEMIVGEQQNLAACVLSPSEGPDDIKAKMEEAIASFESQEQILFLVDLWGGTPFNQASSLLDGHEDWAIVSGLNLPMLIEATMARFSMETAHEIASHVIETAQEGVKVLPEGLMPEAEASSDATVEAVVQGGGIPEGTVIGDGKIDVVLARIDTRLLHGQVATSWTKTVRPNRIIVVSDRVSEDKLRKSMIEQAAPAEAKAHVVPVWKMAEIYQDPRFGKTRALLLFETPQDVLQAVEAGMTIDEVNVGSMAHSKGKVVVNNALSMDQEDIDTFRKLKEHGIRFDVRKVPSDSDQDLGKLLNKAESELKKQG